MATIRNSGESDIECPPKDVYILRFTNAGDIQMRPAFGANKDDPNCPKKPAIELSFKIAEYPYDEDEDDRDWNGFEIRNLFNIGSDFNHAKSKIGALLKALMQVEHIDVGEDIDLEELYGKRIKATVGPNDNGYPRIESPLPYKKAKARRSEDIDEGTVARSRALTEKIMDQSGLKRVEPETEDDDDGAALFDEDAA